MNCLRSQHRIPNAKYMPSNNLSDAPLQFRHSFFLMMASAKSYYCCCIDSQSPMHVLDIFWMLFSDNFLSILQRVNPWIHGLQLEWMHKGIIIYPIVISLLIAEYNLVALCSRLSQKNKHLPQSENSGKSVLGIFPVLWTCSITHVQIHCHS